jgi:thioredoxin-like negative regulator of GroEL
MNRNSATKAEQSVNVVSNRNFEAEILATDRPVLLMCASGRRVNAEQAQVLNQLSDQYRRMVDIYCLEEDYINGFKEMFGIKGTPVFLLFLGGKEKGRMLGRADRERLETFLNRNLALTSTRPS